MITISCDSLGCLGSSVERLLLYLNCSHLVSQVGLDCPEWPYLPDSLSADILDHISLSNLQANPDLFTCWWQIPRAVRVQVPKHKRFSSL